MMLGSRPFRYSTLGLGGQRRSDNSPIVGHSDAIFGVTFRVSIPIGADKSPFRRVAAREPLQKIPFFRELSLANPDFNGVVVVYKPR
jgi:hypothetical protein